MNVLNDFFNADTLSEETMYLMEVRGFLTSLVIQPGSFSTNEILHNILGDAKADKPVTDAITALQQSIEQSLLNGEFPDAASNDDEDSLSLWASGFMQGVFSQQDSWFETYPEEVAELTLPILSCSELLDGEDGDMDDINQNDDMLDDMAERIPDCVIDLYLLFNTPSGA
ncbi:MAG: YecA family protein [Cycloclasticus sp.]